MTISQKNDPGHGVSTDDPGLELCKPEKFVYIYLKMLPQTQLTSILTNFPNWELCVFHIVDLTEHI